MDFSRRSFPKNRGTGFQSVASRPGGTGFQSVASRPGWPCHAGAAILAILFLLPGAGTCLAQPQPSEAAKEKKDAAAAPPGLVRLSKAGDVWFDAKRKAVVADGQICLREGQLEMFACPKGTKEHESIVALNCQAEEIHAGLLAAGAKAGRTVRFDPEYQSATGQTVDIYVLWKDAEGKNHQVRAQDWVRNFKTKEPLSYDWVFAGSGFWKDESGREHYKANGGDLVCVSNFPTATLDLPVESSQANNDLLFEAFKDHIPPRGTKVRLVFIPRQAKQEAKAPADNGKGDTGDKAEPKQP